MAIVLDVHSEELFHERVIELSLIKKKEKSSEAQMVSGGAVVPLILHYHIFLLRNRLVIENTQLSSCARVRQCLLHLRIWAQSPTAACEKRFHNQAFFEEVSAAEFVWVPTML